MAKADSQAVRIASFEAFLQAKFGTLDVTKEQLLNLIARGFIKSGFILPDKDARGTTLLQPSSLYTYYTDKHSKNETILFAMFKDTGYASKLGITNEFTRSIEKQPQLRKASFESFIMKKFGTLDVAKQQLQNLATKDFRTPGFELPKKDPNSILLLLPVSLFSYYAGNHAENETALFAMLKDTGYASKLGITNEDTLPAEQQPKIRKSSFEAFLLMKFGTLDFTKEQLLGLLEHDFKTSRFKHVGKDASGTPLLQPRSLYNHFSDNHGKNETILFALFNDTGYAAKLGITNEDTLPLQTRPSVRKASFDAFLLKKFGTLNVTKEQILNLGTKYFRTTSFELPKTSPSGIPLLKPYSLFAYYAAHHEKNQTILYALLVDTGYAAKLGITNEDTKSKPIVLVDSKVVVKGLPIDADLPGDFKKKDKQDTYEIQVVMATEKKRLEIQQNSADVVGFVPIIDQAIRAAFGLVEIVPSVKAHGVLQQAGANDMFAIKSLYPLDGIFLSGIAAMGCEVLEPNAKFSTSDRRLYCALHTYSATLVVKRHDVDARVDRLIFENALHPDMYAAHTLGAISRWVDIAKNPAALHYSVTFALDFLIRAKSCGAIDETRYSALETEYLDKLGGKEALKMGNFGMQGRYSPGALDLKSPLNLEAYSRIKWLFEKRVQKMDSAFRRHELAAKLK